MKLEKIILIFIYNITLFELSRTQLPSSYEKYNYIPLVDPKTDKIYRAESAVNVSITKEFENHSISSIAVFEGLEEVDQEAYQLLMVYETFSDHVIRNFTLLKFITAFDTVVDVKSEKYSLPEAGSTKLDQKIGWFIENSSLTFYHEEFSNQKLKRIQLSHEIDTYTKTPSEFYTEMSKLNVNNITDIVVFGPFSATNASFGVDVPNKVPDFTIHQILPFDVEPSKKKIVQLASQGKAYLKDPAAFLATLITEKTKSATESIESITGKATVKKKSTTDNAGMIQPSKINLLIILGTLWIIFLKIN